MEKYKQTHYYYSIFLSLLGPCYGELGMGDMKKSSANPVEVTKLDGVHILACGMGISHSVFIARNEAEEDKKAIEKFKILDQSDQDK